MGQARRRFRLTRLRLIAALALCGAIGTLLVIVSGAAALPACTDNFNGSVSNDWGNGLNWTNASNNSIHQVPTSTDVACIPSGDTVDVSESGDEAEAIEGTTATPGTLEVESGSLTLDSDSSTITSNLAALTITSGTLNLTASSDSLLVSGEFQMPQGSGGGTLENGSVTVGGQVDLQTGTLSDVTMIQNGSSSFAIDGSNNLYLSGGSITTNTTDNTAGAVTLSSDGLASIGGPRPVIDSTAEPITIGSGTDDAANFGGNVGYTLEAPGFDVSGSASTLAYGSFVVTGSGVSDLASSVTVEALSVNSSDEISMGASSSDGITVTGVQGQNATIAGTVDGTGTFTQTGNTTTVSSTTFDPGTLDENGGTLDLNGTTASAGDVDLQSGTVAFGATSDSLLVSGEFQMPQGSGGGTWRTGRSRSVVRLICRPGRSRT